MLKSSAPVLPSSTTTRVIDPGPVPATSSATPSPVKSADVTRTPPLSPGKTSRLNRSVPSGLKNRATAGNPAPAPTPNSRKPTRTGAGGRTVRVMVAGVLSVTPLFVTNWKLSGPEYPGAGVYVTMFPTIDPSVPWAGPTTTRNVNGRAGTFGSTPPRVMATAVPASVVTPCGDAVGGSGTAGATTVSVLVAGALRPAPVLMTNWKLSGPEYPGAGVYVTVFPTTGPSVPWVGPTTIRNVSGKAGVFGSEPARVITTGMSLSVTTDWETAVGGSGATGATTVRVTVAGMLS